MTSRQRKAHKIIWILLLCIIPVFIFFAIKDLNFIASEAHTSPASVNVQNTIVKTSENEILKASLIKKDSTYTLEVILKKPIKQPSLVLENLKTKGESILIGQISSVGIYKFEVDELIDTVVLRVPLKKGDINIITVLPL